MKKLLMRTILGFSSLLLMVSNSSAGPLDNISGFSVGVSGSHAVYAATGVETEDNEKIKEYGAFTHSHGSVFVELNMSDTVTVGLDWIPSEITTPQAVNVQHDNLVPPDKSSSAKIVPLVSFTFTLSETTRILFEFK